MVEAPDWTKPIIHGRPELPTEPKGALAYDIYALLYNEASEACYVDRDTDLLCTVIFQERNRVGRMLYYNTENNTLFYISDLSPHYNSKGFYLELHRLLLVYKRWAEEISWNIMSEYYDGEHYDKCVARLELFDMYLKFAYDEAR